MSGPLHTAENDAAVREHLRDHLTDGRWHDSCPYCRVRRIHGGNGVSVIPPG